VAAHCRNGGGGCAGQLGVHGSGGAGLEPNRRVLRCWWLFWRSLPEPFEYPDQSVAIFGILALGLLVYCTFSIPLTR